MKFQLCYIFLLGELAGKIKAKVIYTGKVFTIMFIQNLSDYNK